MTSTKFDDQEITQDIHNVSQQLLDEDEPHCTNTALMPVMPNLPQQYEMLHKVNKGGMGVVYKGRHRYTQSPLAIKFLLGEAARNPDALKRFHFEAKIAMDLKHTHITRVHDFGINEDQYPFIVMDWIDGISLHKKIERDGDLNIEEALRIGIQTADALAYAHSQKIIHRDIKPENLMLTRDHDGRTSVRILDFGVAKNLTPGETPEVQSLTQTGAIIGSPYYMSPEQGLGRPTDERTDIYGLACVLYYAMLGHPPFMGTSSVETIYKHINDPVPPLRGKYKTFPETLQNIILKALEKDPNDRYQTMNEFLWDMRAFQEGQSVPMRQLASQRRSAAALLKILGMFVAGYAITYVLLLAIRTFFAN